MTNLKNSPIKWRIRLTYLSFKLNLLSIRHKLQNFWTNQGKLASVLTKIGCQFLKSIKFFKHYHYLKQKFWSITFLVELLNHNIYSQYHLLFSGSSWAWLTCWDSGPSAWTSAWGTKPHRWSLASSRSPPCPYSTVFSALSLKCMRNRSDWESFASTRWKNLVPPPSFAWPSPEPSSRNRTCSFLQRHWKPRSKTFPKCPYWEWATGDRAVAWRLRWDWDGCSKPKRACTIFAAIAALPSFGPSALWHSLLPAGTSWAVFTCEPQSTAAWWVRYWRLRTNLSPIFLCPFREWWCCWTSPYRRNNVGRGSRLSWNYRRFSSWPARTDWDWTLWKDWKRWNWQFPRLNSQNWSQSLCSLSWTSQACERARTFLEAIFGPFLAGCERWSRIHRSSEVDRCKIPSPFRRAIPSRN